MKNSIPRSLYLLLIFFVMLLKSCGPDYQQQRKNLREHMLANYTQEEINFFWQYCFNDNRYASPLINRPTELSLGCNYWGSLRKPEVSA